MSVNIYDKETDTLTKAAGNAINNIDDTMITKDSTWSSEKINESLVDKENSIKKGYDLFSTIDEIQQIIGINYRCVLEDIPSDLPQGLSKYSSIVCYCIAPQDKWRNTIVAFGSDGRTFTKRGSASTWTELATKVTPIVETLVSGVTSVKVGNIVTLEFDNWKYNQYPLNAVKYAPIIGIHGDFRYFGGTNYYNAIGKFGTDKSFVVYYHGSGNTTYADILANKVTNASLTGSVTYITND